MGKNVRIVLNRRAVSSQLLKSGWISGICEAKASEIAKRCGKGYSVQKPYSGTNRVNVAVVANTAAANRDNKKNNTLLKGMGG